MAAAIAIAVVGWIATWLMSLIGLVVSTQAISEEYMGFLEDRFLNNQVIDQGPSVRQTFSFLGQNFHQCHSDGYILDGDAGKIGNCDLIIVRPGCRLTVDQISYFDQVLLR